MDRTSFLAGRFNSFKYAARGISSMLRTQHNARLHAVATAVVIVAGAVLAIGRDEWCWLVLAMMAVWTAEALNTALELLCDVASPEFHPLVEKAKDVAAGGVLISSAGAVAVGALVFVPHFVQRL